MSRKYLDLVIFSNLPSGGASEMAKENIKYLEKHANVRTISEGDISPANIFDYLVICIFKLSRLHQQFSKEISNKTDLILAYHSWLTKSPYILRYSSLPKVYICQDVMREYYDDYHIRNQSLKEKIINIIRLPIKYIDKINMKSKKLLVIANSKLSKKMIDKAYSINSQVIYPGVNVDKFIKKKEVYKANQVISVGAINHLKGYEYLVRVLSKIDQKIRPNFVIIGNGYDKAYIKRIKVLAKKLRVSLKVRVNITEKELISEYHKSKLFLYSPINEPFGIVVEEAMASGLTLAVSQNGGGYGEIVSKKNGLIFNQHDEEVWANEISKLLINEKMLKKYGEYNIAYVKSFYSSKIMNEKLLKIIKSL